MSGAVGSMPSFTRSGRPCSAASASFSASAPSGRRVDRVRGQPWRLARRPRSGRWASGAMLDSRRREGPSKPRSCRGRGPAGACTRRRSRRALGPTPDAADERHRHLRHPRRARRRPEAPPQAPAAASRSSSPSLLLGLVSFVFGLFVSVASDLPSLERFSQIKDAQSSQLLDDLGHPIGVAQPAEPRDPHARARSRRSSRRR